MRVKRKEIRFMIGLFWGLVYVLLGVFVLGVNSSYGQGLKNQRFEKQEMVNKGASVVNKGMREVLIPVPNPCVFLLKVEKGKVYLEDKDERGVCIQKISYLKVYIIPDDEGEVEIYYKGRLWQKVKVGKTLEGVLDYLFNASLLIYGNDTKELVSNFERERLQDNTTKREVEKVISYYKGEKFQGEVNQYYKDLSERMLSKGGNVNEIRDDKIRGSKGREGNKDRKGDEGESRGSVKRKYFYKGDIEVGGVLREGEFLVLFVSESVPREVIRGYIESIDVLFSDEERRRIFFVLRGGIGGLTYIKDTVRFVYSFLRKDEGCDELKGECELYNIDFQINPVLYRRFGIQGVPAIVYMKVRDMVGGLNEYVNVNDLEVERVYISYGDANLFYHLYEIGLWSNNQKMVDLVKEFLRY